MNGRLSQIQDGLVEGLVEATNATGIKIGGAWLNVSQFHPLGKLPEAGARVRLKIDSKGFIKTLEVMDATERKPAGLSLTDKDERITRLAVLKAAAEFVGLWGQTREEIKSDHVLLIADKWLDWINK